MTAAKPAATLAEALVSAQADLPAVEPNAVNPHFKSRFVTLDHLIAKTRPVLNRHGLAITQEPTRSMSGEVELVTTLIHVSGQTRSSTMRLILERENMQGLGAALTYARRYAWAAVLGISADEDDDGNQASAEKPAARTPDSRKAAPANVNPDTGEISDPDVLAQANIVRGGIVRLAPTHPEWKLEAVIAGAAKRFGRPVAALEDLTSEELGQIAAAMPGEA